MNLSEGDRIVAVGDSLATDIQGANTQRIHSILTTCGVHKYDLWG